MIKVELVHEMAKMPTKAIETDACYDVMQQALHIIQDISNTI